MSRVLYFTDTAETRVLQTTDGATVVLITRDQAERMARHVLDNLPDYPEKLDAAEA